MLSQNNESSTYFNSEHENSFNQEYNNIETPNPDYFDINNNINP